MEKIELSTDTGSKAEVIGNFWAIEYKLNEMVNWINKQQARGEHDPK